MCTSLSVASWEAVAVFPGQSHGPRRRRRCGGGRWRAANATWQTVAFRAASTAPPTADIASQKLGNRRGRGSPGFVEGRVRFMTVLTGARFGVGSGDTLCHTERWVLARVSCRRAGWGLRISYEWRRSFSTVKRESGILASDKTKVMPARWCRRPQMGLVGRGAGMRRPAAGNIDGGNAATRNTCSPCRVGGDIFCLLRRSSKKKSGCRDWGRPLPS